MWLSSLLLFPFFSAILFSSIGVNAVKYGGRQQQTQIYPYDSIDNGGNDDADDGDEYYAEDEDGGLNQLFEDDDDFEGEQGKGRNGQDAGPAAAFWLNSIGPFLYTFEDANRRQVRQLWQPVLAQLNVLRQQNLGPSFRKLVWDEQMARILARKEYTQMAPLIVPIPRPRNGLLPNLNVGIQLLFQAVIHRYIRCEETSKNCKGKRDKQFRFPIELVDSKAHKIGCVARLFKNRGDRRLQFGALCTTDRSVKEARENLVLFRLNQIQNGQLRRKLLRDAVNEFEDENGRREDGEGAEWEGESDGNGGGLRVDVQEGDLLQAKVDAIVNPAKPSLSTGPQSGAEAIAQVLAAKSILDVLSAEDGAINQKRMERALKRLAELVDPEDRNNQKDGDKAKQAQKKVQKWQEMVADGGMWAKLVQEAKERANGGGGRGERAGDGIAERIIRAGGKVLAQKLAQLAQEKGGFPVGDAVMTESFQIRENYFAKKIIHTVPPTTLQSQRDKDKLGECYKRTLKLAADKGLTKIAFPEMMPPGSDENTRQEAVKIGLMAIKKWMEKNQKKGENGKSSSSPSSIRSIVFRVQKDPTMLAYYREQIKATFGQQLTGNSNN